MTILVPCGTPQTSAELDDRHFRIDASIIAATALDELVERALGSEPGPLGDEDT